MMAERQEPAREADARTPTTEEEHREEGYAGPVPQGDGDEGTGEPQTDPTLEDVALGRRKQTPGG
jgi:hypothetical protein